MMNHDYATLEKMAADIIHADEPDQVVLATLTEAIGEVPEDANLREHPHLRRFISQTRLPEKLKQVSAMDDALSALFWPLAGITAVIGEPFVTSDSKAFYWVPRYIRGDYRYTLTWETGHVVFKVAHVLDTEDPPEHDAMRKEDALTERLIGHCVLHGIDHVYEEFIQKTKKEIAAEKRAKRDLPQGAA